MTEVGNFGGLITPILVRLFDMQPPFAHHTNHQHRPAFPNHNLMDQVVVSHHIIALLKGIEKFMTSSPHSSFRFCKHCVWFGVPLPYLQLLGSFLQNGLPQKYLSKSWHCQKGGGESDPSQEFFGAFDKSSKNLIKTYQSSNCHIWR